MISVLELSDKIGARIIGDESRMLSAPNRIEFAGKGEVTFLQHAKYLQILSECNATAIVTTEALVDKSLPFIWLVVEDPYLAFAWVVEAFYPKRKPNFRSHQYYAESDTVFGENVQIGAGVYIGASSAIGDNAVLYPQVYIGNRVRIGENVTLYPGVKILDDTIIGNNCTIHAGTVIGADGFGFAPKADGSFQKIPQMGNVVIEDDVEIGANACIDRATLGSTIIRKGVKLDNLIQIGHNVQIGSHTVIAAQTGIAGSCQIGDNNQIGGQVGFAPHIKTAKGVRINAQSGMSKSVLQEGSSMTGTPAQPYMDYNRSQVFLKKLESEIKYLREEIKSINTNLEK